MPFNAFCHSKKNETKMKSSAGFYSKLSADANILAGINSKSWIRGAGFKKIREKTTVFYMI